MFAKLKKQSDYYNFRQRTLGDFVRDARRDGLARDARRTARVGRDAHERRPISPTSTGATYTYLMNGQPPAANWTGLFTPGERVRLRFINGSAMTYFDVRIPGVKLTVVAADGLPVRPVTVDEFRIAVAETYDVIVEPAGARRSPSSRRPWTAPASPPARWRCAPDCARPCRRSIRGRC